MRSRAFISLYIAVFVATLGISMVGPLLPVYAEDLGATGVWLGVAFSAFAVVQTIFGPFAGRLSDRYGRKPFIIAGLLVYMVAGIGYLTAGSFYQVIAFRAFSGVGTSLVFSVARAYVGDITPKGQEGRWLGVFATADFIGFGTGPLIAGALRQFVGFESVFVVMAILMALSAFILLVWLPRHSSAELLRRQQRAEGIAQPAVVPFSVALKDRLVLAVTIHHGLISLSMGATFAFLALRLERDLGVTPFLIGLAFATQDITGGAAQPLFGRFADKYNRRALVAIGLGINGVLLALLGVVPSYVLSASLLFLMGGAGALSQVASSAIQVVAGRRAGMGTVLGLGAAANGAGIVIGSIVGGIVVDLSGLGATFILGGIVMVLGAPLFLGLTRGLATAEPEVRVPVAGPGASVDAAAGGS
ncbi:MAG TPA: MFS transporter [Tepidiformaceae bacterium]|nr:MFS transporter [Tepidiformaceae bacterium]